MSLTNHDSAIGGVARTFLPAEYALMEHLLDELKPIAADAIEGEADIAGKVVDALAHEFAPPGLGLILPPHIAEETFNSLGGKLITIFHLRTAPTGPPPGDPTTGPAPASALAGDADAPAAR